MSGVAFVALVALPLCAGVIAYLIGFDNGYLRARRELRETSARRTHRTPAILGMTRRIERDDG